MGSEMCIRDRSRAPAPSPSATSDSLDARAVVVRASARGRRGRGISGERARGLIFKRLDGGKTGDGRAMAD